MKKIVILFFLFLVTSFSVAQSTQNGIVKEYNDAKRKIPLAGVELVVNNAGSNVSGKDGKFTLSFRTLKPGDKVDVRKIEKAGYEIFNKDALDAWRIANDGSEFTIVLCKSAKFKALKDQYNAVASKSYARQQKKDEEHLANLLKEGKLQQAEYEKKLKELKDKYDEQLENLDNYIDRFARIDLETISKEEQKIIEMVKAGNIEEAIAAYEGLNLEEKYAQAVENIHSTENAISELERIKQENIKAKEMAVDAVFRKNDVYMLRGGEISYNKIEENLRTIAFIDTTDIKLQEVLADFLREQNKYQEALPLYVSCMNKYILNNDSLKVSRTANKCAGLASNLREYDTAIKNFERALLYMPYSASDSLFHHQYFTVYLNMSKMYGKMGNYEKSKQCLIDASKEIDLLPDGLEKEKSYSSVYANLSLVYSNLGDKVNAKRYSFLSANSEKNILKTEDNEVNKKGLYNSLLNLCNIYMYSDSLDIAMNILEEAQEICIQLYNHNPQKYIEDVSSNHYTKGYIYYSKKEYKKSKTELLLCKEIREKLYSTDNRLYATELSDCYNLLGCVYDELDEIENAIHSYSKSMDISKSIYSYAQTINALKDIASVNINLGLLYSKVENTDKTIFYLEEALNNYTSLLKHNTEQFADVYIGICYELASSYMKVSKPSEAKKVLDLGLKIDPNDEDLLELIKELK